ncbi:MAG: amino acid adenylation domain-containing protein [Flammeovirgaceae bacterium]
MMAPEIINMVDLIKSANAQGVILTYKEGRLIVNVEEGKRIAPELLQQLKEHKQALIDFLKEKAAVNPRQQSSIVAFAKQVKPAGEKIPLSFSQERLWFVDKLQGSVNYHIPLQLKWTGRLDKQALHEAFQWVIHRHEVLRTVFKEEEGQAYQHILPSDDWELEEVQLKENDHLATMIEEKLGVPFKLSQDYPIRAYLFEEDHQQFTLLIIFHHIAADGWSSTVFLNEFLQAYTASCKQQAAQLPELPIQFADYARWERHHMQGAFLNKKLAYWQEKLEGVLPLELPLDYPRPAVKSNRGAAVELHLSSQLSHQLMELTKTADVTLFMLMQAAIKVLLFRYSGQTDICIGSPIANRQHAELEPLIGFFLNNLVLRDELDGTVSFETFLSQVKQTTLEAYEHQEVPFEQLVDLLEIERDMSITPLFQVTLTLHNAIEKGEMMLDGVQLGLASNEQKTTVFDLSFHVTETTEGLRVGLNYCTDLFEESSIRRMMATLETLLESICADRTTSLELLPLLDQADIQQQLALTKTAEEYPTEETIVSIFEQKVQEYPNAPAITCEGEELTYQELNQRANQLAHYLKEKGVKQEDLVVVCVHRSLDLVISLLAVIKAGAAYVPVDPDYPQERISYTIKDANPSLLLIHGTVQEKLADFKAIPTVNLSEAQEELTCQSVANLNTPISPDQLLYVIYTSGTTGKPKGVLIEHRNVVRLFFTDRPLFDFTDKDTWSLFHSYCFDFSVWEMYGALLYGARLVVIPKETAQNTQLFAEVLEKEQITILNQTPTAFYNLQEYITDSLGDIAIRYVIFGGEALQPSKLKPWKERLPDCKLINMYGITETTVHVTYKEIGLAEIAQGTSNIGKPIPTLSCYILDKHMQLMPQGAIGELYVGGAGLARAYLKRPELTAERFVANPFHANERLYKTGDLAQITPNDDLRYCGRIDNQVKIRGYRIELGEVEHALLSLPTVAQTTVMVTSNKESKQLVAYVVLEAQADIGSIRSELKNLLPSYMIPAFIMELDRLPLNRNGKINKSAFPQPNATNENQFIAPKTAIEKQLAAIWKKQLHIDKVGLTDDFFTVGGDSITVIKIISSIQKQFQQTIVVADFYKEPTIAALANLLEPRSGDAVAEGTMHRQQVIDDLEQLKSAVFEKVEDPTMLADAYPMTDIQKGMVFASLANQEIGIYHDQFISVFQEVERDTFELALTCLAEKHSILRTAYDLHNYREEVQLVFKKVPIQVAYHDITHLNESEQTAFIKTYQEKERKQPFDFAKAPLWRSSLLKVSQDQLIHVFQFHHSILDGWSYASLMKELQDTYAKLVTNPAYSLTPLQCNYRDAVLESRLELSNEQTKNYWSSTMADYKRFAIFEEQEILQRHLIRFEKDELTHLRQIAQTNAVTLKTIFLAAYLYALNRFQYANDLTVGLVSNTRPMMEDGDQLLGCFLNTIPFRHQMEVEGESWLKLLTEVDQKLKEVRKHDRLTLFELSNLVGETASNANPFFDVIFNFTDFHVLGEQEQEQQPSAFTELGDYTATNTFMDFTVSTTGNRLNAGFWLRKKLKNGITVEGIGNYFKKAIHAMIQDLDQPIQSNALLDEGVKSKILNDFNATVANYPTHLTLVDLLVEQAQKTPDAIALHFEGQELSYRELDVKSSNLANYLREKGIKEDSLLPICVERSLEMMVGIIGILKAGSAYVPIDPEYPDERIKYILEDTEAQFVLSQSAQRARFEQYAVEVICLDTLECAQGDSPEPVHALTPSHLAYVIYTSGSTGKPKGVMIEHASIVNRLFWTQERYQLQAGKDVVLQKTTYCFDVSVWELFWPLITGCKLVLAKPEGHKDSNYLQHIIQNQQVSTMHFVPSMLEVFLLSVKENACQSLQRVLCSGEALKPSHVQAFHEKLSHAELHNLYGPTEAAIDVTSWQADFADPFPAVVPIGKPVANTQLYVFTKDQTLADIGVPGELHIGGIQVARGYVKRPELTAEKFIDNPLDPSDSHKLYKTGDLVSWLPDGNLVYLGRIDHQVKIRGYRIELGEIEQVLQQSDLVDQCVVLVHENDLAEKQLIAYLIGNMHEGAVEELRQELAQKLPEYMIPSFFIPLTEMPLTINGKLDRKALPKPTGNRLSTREFVGPQNDIEQTLADYWAEYLQVSPISIHDNFFELGGNSLTGTRIMLAIQKIWDISIEMKVLFQFPTIAGLSKYIKLSVLEQAETATNALDIQEL